MKIETSQRSEDFRVAGKMAWLVMVITFFSCAEKKKEDPLPPFVKYVPTFVSEVQDTSKVFAVIEVPAGTSTLQAIDSTGEIGIQEGKPVDFLPFPGNFGFIAGCVKRDTISGRLIPLAVMVLMDALKEESMIEVIPVGTLRLRKGSEPYPVVISIPVDSALQTITAHNFVDFITEYDAAKSILQQWFLNYRGREMFSLIGWQDEHYARKLIADWRVNQ
jgi:inorganic pyrophosphatase